MSKSSTERTIKKCNKTSAENSPSQFDAEFAVLHQDGEILNDITTRPNSTKEKVDRDAIVLKGEFNKSVLLGIIKSTGTGKDMSIND